MTRHPSPGGVRSWFAAHVTPTLGVVAQHVTVPGGTSGNVLVVDGEHDGRPCRVVVRRDGPAPAGAGRTDVGAQAVLLRELATRDVPVPGVLLLPSARLEGERAVVLEWVEGEAPQDADCFAPTGLLGRLGPSGRDLAASSAARAVARLHDATAPGARAVPLTGRDLPAARLLEETTAMLTTRAVTRVEGRALDALARRLPPEPAPVLCWGDARLANTVLRDERVAGLIDWEHAGRAAREVDVAWWGVTCAYFRAVARHVWGSDAGSAFDRDAFRAAYEHESGHRLQHLEWYEAHAVLRLHGLTLVVDRLARLDRRLRTLGVPSPGELAAVGAFR